MKKTYPEAVAADTNELSSSITEARFFQDAIQRINPRQRHLILFDLDDNLITTVDLHAFQTPRERQYHTRARAPIRSTLCAPASDSWLKYAFSQGHNFIQLIQFYDFLQSFIKTQAVEPDKHYRLPGQTHFDPNNKLQGLIDQGHLVMAITSRGPKSACNTEFQLRQCGFRFRDVHRSNLGIDHCTPEGFNFTDPKKEGHSQKYFFHNVIYCEGSDKGQVLCQFLEKTQYGKAIAAQRFERIFFMDDDRYKCESLLAVAKQLGKPITAVHYTHVKQHYTLYEHLPNSIKQENEQRLNTYARFFTDNSASTAPIFSVDSDPKKATL